MKYSLLPILASLLNFTAATQAHAQPPQKVVDVLEKSYSPASNMKEIDAGRSLALCQLKDIGITAKDPLTEEMGTTNARAYLPLQYNNEGAEKTIILLPPTGGENILDRGYANYLCFKGFRTIILQNWPGDGETTIDLGMHDKGAIRSLAAIRRIVDYVKPNRDSQIGILGTSIGAVSSALALGFDKRINVAALIVGGIGMAEIIAQSDESGASKLRASRMAALKFKSQEEYMAALKSAIHIEPGLFHDYTGEKKVLSFIGAADTTVPTKNQMDLSQAFKANAITYKGNHSDTIFHVFCNYRKTIFDFFASNLK